MVNLFKYYTPSRLYEIAYNDFISSINIFFLKLEIIMNNNLNCVLACAIGWKPVSFKSKLYKCSRLNMKFLQGNAIIIMTTFYKINYLQNAFLLYWYLIIEILLKEYMVLHTIKQNIASYSDFISPTAIIQYFVHSSDYIQQELPIQSRVENSFFSILHPLEFHLNSLAPKKSHLMHSLRCMQRALWVMCVPWITIDIFAMSWRQNCENAPSIPSESSFLKGEHEYAIRKCNQ